MVSFRWIQPVCRLECKYAGRVGGRAITYYLTTTMVAVVLGIILVVTIHPGRAGQDKVSIIIFFIILFLSLHNNPL